MSRAAWNAGKGFINGEEAGSTAADDGGKRDAGMDTGKPSGTVAGRTGGTAEKHAGAARVKERTELENRVHAAGAQYLSGKDIGLAKGSERRSFREAPESTWTDSMKDAAAMLRREGFKDVHFTVGAISIENQKAKVTRYADGVVTGDTVWINATSKKWTVEQLAKHEVFHHQIEDWPYTMDAVRQALADELGEDGIQELAQRYAEAYEGCYGTEDIDAYVEEICADAYAGMDRLPEAKTEIMQKAAQRAQDAQRTAENSDIKKKHEQFSMIGRGENGLKTYKSDFADGMTKAQKQAYLFELINSVWARKPLRLSILRNGQEVPITARFDGESNGEKFSGKMAFGNRNGTRTERLITLNLANDIWEIASESRYDNWKDGHKQTEMHDGNEQWNYFVNEINYEDAKYPERNGVYDFNLDVLEREDGNFVYTFHLKKRRDNAPRTFDAGVDSKNATDANSSTSSIRSSEQKSQEKFSAAEDAATPQENDKTVLSYFGRTYKWSETGYVLLNGARLDFSGRHEGGSGGYRSVDHRDIIDALGEDYGGGDYTGGMVRFMQEGNIRISPESGGINLAVMPTKAQMDSLSDFISKERGEVILDIDDASGNTISSTEYPRGTHANKVLQDIRNYFNDGTMPEVRDSPTVGQFRYSVAEDAGADEAADVGTQELLAETLPQANRDQFMRFATEITDDLVTPLTADMETLRKEMRPRVLALIDQFLQDGALKKSSVNALFDEAYARSAEMNKAFEGKYAELRDMIRRTPVTFTQEDTRQIEQYDYFDQRALKNLTIQEQGGGSIGELYSDLSALLPDMFPSGIKNPAKQIMRISSVYRRIGKAMALFTAAKIYPLCGIGKRKELWPFRSGYPR